MPGETSVAGAVRSWSGTLLRGETDPRLRATWRVLLAAVVLIPLSEALALLVVGVTGLEGRLPVGVTQATFLAAVLVGWARYVDERPLSEYGVAATPAWTVDLLAGVAAVGIAWGLWFGVGAAAGWTEVTLATSGAGGSIVVGLVVGAVALGLNVWVQDTVFWALVARNAGEGFHARGLAPTHALAGAWLVGVLYFVLAHGPSGLGPVVNLVVGGAVFGLLYLHTGDLALTVGAHLGNNLVSSHVFVGAGRTGDLPALFAVSGGIPGPAMLTELAFPRLVLAYVLLVGWIRVRKGEVDVDEDLARWSGR